VAGGWRTTLKVLRQSENEWAERLLLTVIEDRARSESVEALGILLTHKSAKAAELIVRQWQELPKSWQLEVARHPAGIHDAIRAALLSNETATFQAACDICLAGEDFDAIPLLVEIAEDASRQGHRYAASIVLSLADLLHEKCHAPRDYSDRRDPQIIRQHVGPCLELAAAKFGEHQQLQLVEAFLLNTTRENATLRQALQSSRDALHTPIQSILETSPRFGIFRLLLSFLDASGPPMVMLDTALHRQDPDYFDALCLHLADTSSHARANLKRITRLEWLPQLDKMVTWLSEEGQCGLVRLLAATSIAKPLLFDALDKILGRGFPAARALATAALAGIPGDEADRRITILANDRDPVVQASALRQLRPRQLPGGLATLLSRADNRDPHIDEAVRDSLAEFTFARYLAAFDSMTPTVRESTGAIVRKVDRETPGLLALEIEASGRVRKLRAIEIAVVLHMVDVLDESLVAAMRDEDHAVRSAAASALADSPSPTARAALRQALVDTDMEVRSAAEKALGQRTNNAPSPSDTIGWQQFLEGRGTRME
jgi:hypothetical protein